MAATIDTAPDSTEWCRFSAAPTMFALTACILAFEIAVTRICSVLLQYHLIFAVVSFSVLGLGLGGFLAHLWTRHDEGRLRPLSAVAAWAIAPAMLLTLLTLVVTPFAAYWPVLLLLVLPPFIATGMFQSTVLRALHAHAGTLYAADLAGGATGALGVVFLLDALGGPLQTVALLAVATACVAWGWGSRGPRGRFAAVGPPAMACLALGFFSLQWTTSFLDVRYERAPHKLIARALKRTGQGTPRLVPELQRWDAYSRVDVVHLDTGSGAQRLVFIDGETPTVMLQPNGLAPGAGGLPIHRALPALPYRVRLRESVLAIGAGGGYDIVTAKRFAAARVDAVELNEGVLDVVARAREFHGDVYAQEGVRLVHGEGRQFVGAADSGTYDLVVLLLAQSLAGNLREYALSENYLYTREAFEDYFRVLRKEGSLAILVNNETLLKKLARTALEVLTERGVDAPNCMAAFESAAEHPYDRLLLVQTVPFEYQDLVAIAREAEGGNYVAMHLPPAVARGGAELTLDTLRSDPLNLTSATDDRPFFFHIAPGLPRGLSAILVGSALTLLVACAWFLRTDSTAGPRRSDPSGRDRLGRGSTAAYFVLLGFGFLMVEVVVLQKTILLLGFPALNLSVVLATFLLAAGLGSAASGLLGARVRKRFLRLLLVGLALLLPLAVPLLEFLQRVFIAETLPTRCLLVVAAIAPFAFLMGMPLPLGVRLLPETAVPWLPWLWGLNGVASVLGSALVVAVALQVGFRVAALLPALCYLLAAVFSGHPSPQIGANHAR